MNNNFLVTSGVIRRYFYEWRRQDWKLLVNHRTSKEKNLVIYGNWYIILFLTYFSGSKTERNRWKVPPFCRRTMWFMVGQLAVVLWRHANTELWRHFHHVCKWVACVFPASSSWLSLVNSESDAQRVHWPTTNCILTCHITSDGCVICVRNYFVAFLLNFIHAAIESFINRFFCQFAVRISS